MFNDRWNTPSRYDKNVGIRSTYEGVPGISSRHISCIDIIGYGVSDGIFTEVYCIVIITIAGQRNRLKLFGIDPIIDQERIWIEILTAIGIDIGIYLIN